MENLPAVGSEVAATQAELFAQALEGYLAGAMQLAAILEDDDLSQVTRARAAFAAALAKLQRSKESIEEDWENPLELGL